MNYYVKDNKLFATDVPIADDGFKEITFHEYELRMALARYGREKGTPADSTYDW